MIERCSSLWVAWLVSGKDRRPVPAMGRKPTVVEVLLVCVLQAGCSCWQSRVSCLHSVLRMSAFELLVERKRSWREFRKLFRVNHQKPSCPRGGKLANRMVGGGCLYKEGREHVAMMGELDDTRHSAVCTLKTSLSARPSQTSQITTSSSGKSSRNLLLSTQHCDMAWVGAWRQSPQVARERRSHNRGFSLSDVNIYQRLWINI
jgi:hypothetical protein